MIKIVVNPATGRIEKIEFPPSDIKTQSQAFETYQALSDEIRRFSKRAAKIIRLERALGRLT